MPHLSAIHEQTQGHVRVDLRLIEGLNGAQDCVRCLPGRQEWPQGILWADLQTQTLMRLRQD